MSNKQQTSLIKILVLLFVIISVGCVHQKQIKNENLYVSYFTSAEAMYEKIQVTDSKLSHTYFDDKNNKCANWIAQSPCWLDQELTTVERTLSQKEIDELINLINTTHFLELNTTYGGAKEGQRYYAEVISVKINGQEKTVTYQSFPEASPPPEAFTTLRKTIEGLVK